MTIDAFRAKLPILIAIFVGVMVALACGALAGKGDFGKLGWIGAAVLYGVALLVLRERIWILVPLLWPLIGRIEFLPIPFSPRDVGVMLAVSGVLICYAFRLIKVRPKFTILDVIFWANIVWLGISWIRNPVGVAAFDSTRVGGRPYFDTVIGVGAFWVLSRGVAGTSLLANVPRMIVAVVAIFFFINAALFFIPALQAYVFPFYTGWEGIAMNVRANLVEPGTEDQIRYSFFRDICRQLSVFLCAYYAPWTLLNPLKWGRFALLLATIVGLLLSGFRGFVVAFFGLFVLSAYFRGGITPAARAIALAALGTGILLFVHSIHPLPFAAQRALAFIPESIRPVALDQLAVESGTESTRWRVEMWKLALTTDRYISDKWRGDGFGIEKWQVTVAEAAAQSSDYYGAQESMAIIGEFHSGPVSTIRVVGYIGLAMFIALLIMMARKAAQLIYACKGTPLERPAFYICLPIVFEPFWFIFVFGGFNMAPAWAAVSFGCVKLLENSLERWKMKTADDSSARSSELDLSVEGNLLVPANVR